jgi:hypothetical protein
MTETIELMMEPLYPCDHTKYLLTAIPDEPGLFEIVCEACLSNNVVTYIDGTLSLKD